MTLPRPDLLAPGLRIVVVGTVRRGRLDPTGHHYAGPGNKFWTLLHAGGLTPVLLSPADDDRLIEYGIGVTDLVTYLIERAGAEPEVGYELQQLHDRLDRADPAVVAFVSKTAASRYARAAGQRAPIGYGELSWSVDGRPAFVLPGPSGANNGMSLPLRTALWTDLADFLDTLSARPRKSGSGCDVL